MLTPEDVELLKGMKENTAISIPTPDTWYFSSDDWEVSSQVEEITLTLNTASGQPLAHISLTLGEAAQLAKALHEEITHNL